MPNRKPFKLGTYQLGHKWVDVWLDPTSVCGSAEWDMDKKRNTRIMVGTYASLWEAAGILMHEAAETVIDDMRCRFKRSSSFNHNTSDCYHFHLDHQQFTEVCSRVGAFMYEVLPEIDKYYKKAQK